MEENRMHVRIVPMTAEHLDEVAELERICFSVPWSRNMLAEELDNALSAMLVALDDQGRVAGYAGLQVILDEGYITNVAVRLDCRRRGVGRRMIEAVIASVTRFRPREVLVLTFAPEFFRRLGFAETPKTAVMHKLYTGCINCTKHADPFTCPEIAMKRDMRS